MTSEAADPASRPAKKLNGDVQIKREACKGCGFCIEFCPTHALEFEKGYNAKGYHVPFLAKPDRCNGCDVCGLFCPDFAIFGFRDKRDKVV